jgi:hypothetical protein
MSIDYYMDDDGRIRPADNSRPVISAAKTWPEYHVYEYVMQRAGMLAANLMRLDLNPPAGGWISRLQMIHPMLRARPLAVNLLQPHLIPPAGSWISNLRLLHDLDIELGATPQPSPHFLYSNINALLVTPAKAGVHGSVGILWPAWIPAFAGMTKRGV